MLSRRVPPERHAPQDPRAREHLALVSGSELLRRALRDAMSQRAAVLEAAKVGHHRQRAAIESVNGSCGRLRLPLRGAPSSICPAVASAAGHSYYAAGSAVVRGSMRRRPPPGHVASVLQALAKSAHQKSSH